MKISLRLSLSLLLTSLCAFAGTVSPDFKVTNPSTPVRVVVQFDKSPALTLLAAMGTSGAQIQKKFKALPKTMTFTVPAGMVPLLSKLPGVRYISPDRSIKKKLDITAATTGA